MNAYKDRIAETERVKEGKRARVERGAGDVPMESRVEGDEQMPGRPDASGGDITENQHEESRMREIHIGKRGSETASEEQADKLRKTVRFAQDSSSASSSSIPAVSLEYPASGEKQDRPGPVLVQNSGHVDDDIQISALDAFYEMDGRNSRYIREVLEWCRAEDTEDLRRSELDELVENMSCLNVFEGKNWKTWKSDHEKETEDEKSWKTWKSNPKSVMNEKNGSERRDE